MKKVVLVLSCYNEEKCVKKMYDNAINQLSDNFSYEFLFVNDGSIDNTKNELLDLKQNNQKQNVNITIIDLSKNFGHEAAMLAGLDNANGDYVVFMDSDGQHPISAVNEALSKLENGSDIVSMVRTENKDQTFIGSFFSSTFYKMINKLSGTSFIENASDFFAVDKKVIDYLKCNYRERIRFMRGIVQNIGFERTKVFYKADSRISGKTHYNYKKLTSFAITTMLCYTNTPLHLGVAVGMFSGFLGVVLLIYTFITRKTAPSGYATIIIFLCFMFAILFMLVGIIGEYLAIIFAEIKNRPNYIIKQIL